MDYLVSNGYHPLAFPEHGNFLPNVFHPPLPPAGAPTPTPPVVYGIHGMPVQTVPPEQQPPPPPPPPAPHVVVGGVPVPVNVPVITAPIIPYSMPEIPPLRTFEIPASPTLEIPAISGGINIPYGGAGGGF